MYEYKKLSEICRKKKKKFGASVWDEKLVSEFKDYLDFYKVGSGDITNYQLIKEILKTKKPVIFSTGLSSINEIENLIKFINEEDSRYFTDKKIAILHCITAYPANIEECFLGNIDILKNKFKLPIGYSDHTLGDFVPMLAVLRGAEIIEKHYSDDLKRKSFRDHQISMNKQMVDDFLKKMKLIPKILQIMNVRLSHNEKKQNNFYLFRRSIFARRDILKGEIISIDDLICLRPKIGICASKIFEIVGCVTKENIKANNVLNEKDIYL